MSARKAGVKKAIGKYVGFVDSDDYVDEDMFQSLYDSHQKYNVDMVSSGFIIEGNYKSYHYDCIDEGLYDLNEMENIRERIFYNIKTFEIGIRGTICCKLFKSNYLVKIYNDFPSEISYAEDKMLILRYLLECKSVYIIHKAYYHYVYHDESMIRKGNINYLKKIDAVYSYLNKLYDHPKFTDSMRMQAEIYIVELLYKGINSRMGFKNRNLLWIDPYYLKN